MLEARERAREAVALLVAKFRRNEADYQRAVYNETQARTEFITPLLEAFGWDVHNAAGLPLSLREVVEEATVEVGPERLNKRPDYELRLARQRKLFVEAKKPSVSIDRSQEAAFQTRRYGYSASLPISVLTNFRQLAIYDCRPVPDAQSEARVARILLLTYDEFDARFDELWPLLSRESVYSGKFDEIFEADEARRGADQFDDYFLTQVRRWRARLAEDIYAAGSALTAKELTYVVQLFLSRIIFLRICEDRDIERYETLKDLPADNTFDALMAEIRRADAFYNSGIFRLLDDARLGVRINDDTLHGILAELYYPESPYTFAVVETEVLGEIYEQFLGEEIQIQDGHVAVVSKPEVRESGGVVPTPRYVVDAIVDRTLLPSLRGRSPEELDAFTIADICCGSGIFLLSVFEMLLDHYLAWYEGHDRASHVGSRIYDAGAGQWRLTYAEKRRILCAHIRGVDIDAGAVEVARFSLLLKLIEDEEAASLQDFVNHHGARALPSLDSQLKAGNSLVSEEEWEAALGPMTERLAEKINPFSWRLEFPREFERGGFDVIVGNPPYIRIQNMATYSPEEVAYYHDPRSPYSTARRDNFDKYALFIERSLELLTDTGRLGVITPHKFMNTQAGRSLRSLLTARPIIEHIIHFGVKQVFGRRAANYTCVLIASKSGVGSVTLEKPSKLEEWRYSGSAEITELAAEALTADNWQFQDELVTELFERIREAHPTTISDVADVFVGVQTSADEIYIFESVGETEDTVTHHWGGRDWPIEKAALRPSLLDVQLHAYAPCQSNTWMIFPYAIEDTGDKQVARLLQPDEMAARFPVCLAYLTARQQELERRNVQGGPKAERQFYQFGRSQSLKKFGTPKIIFPVLSLEPRYSYDDTDVVVTGGGNGPYYMARSLPGAPIDDYYLLASLNHPVSEAFIRTNTSTFRGGYYSHGKQYVDGVPIPLPSEADLTSIREQVTELIQLKARADRAGTPHDRERAERRVRVLQSRIENRMTAIWGLSEDDMELIHSVPVPT
ncbi:Eco57I restriction-modification methylase domain-containing protein [Dyella ginsengisoli]|uniref:Eco57I restriction-modification methylase domain-containing protein n=1 Tax=Dyella ginsengisoli TaxID=363848 RepID=UPI00034D67A6|nr:N-6 DNA methylase [Dyella ginsengisoli]